MQSLNKLFSLKNKSMLNKITVAVCFMDSIRRQCSARFGLYHRISWVMIVTTCVKWIENFSPISKPETFTECSQKHLIFRDLYKPYCAVLPSSLRTSAEEVLFIWTDSVDYITYASSVSRNVLKRYSLRNNIIGFMAEKVKMWQGTDKKWGSSWVPGNFCTQGVRHAIICTNQFLSFWLLRVGIKKRLWHDCVWNL